jgi:hypothetical protein
MAKPNTMARLPPGTTVQLKRHSTVVTGVVELYDPATAGPEFPVVYTWNGARIWTISDSDECTVVVAISPKVANKQTGQASA